MTTLDIRKAALRIAYQIMDSSGGSVSIVCGVPSPTNGYMVSLPGHESILPAGDSAYVNRLAYFAAAAESYAEDHRAILAQPAHFLGAWLDGDRLVFDVSVNVFEFEQAVEMGWTSGQDAIYDLEEQRDIITRPGRVVTITEDDQRSITLANAKHWVHKWITARVAQQNASGELFSVIAETEVSA